MVISFCKIAEKILEAWVFSCHPAILRNQSRQRSHRFANKSCGLSVLYHQSDHALGLPVLQSQNGCVFCRQYTCRLPHAFANIQHNRRHAFLIISIPSYRNIWRNSADTSHSASSSCCKCCCTYRSTSVDGILFPSISNSIM